MWFAFCACDVVWDCLWLLCVSCACLKVWKAQAFLPFCDCFCTNRYSLYKGCFEKQPSLILFLFKPRGVLFRKKVRPVPCYHSCSSHSWNPETVAVYEMHSTFWIWPFVASAKLIQGVSNFAALSVSVLYLNRYFFCFSSLFPNFKAVNEWEQLSQTRALYLSLLFSAATSRPRASLLSVASSSSLCSFLRFALIRWDSSSASSSCLFSCLSRVLPFSA